jgi:hypothetical protein
MDLFHVQQFKLTKMSVLLYGLGRVTHIKKNNKNDSSKYVGSCITKRSQNSRKATSNKELITILPRLAEDIELSSIALNSRLKMSAGELRNQAIYDKVHLIPKRKTVQKLKHDLKVANARFDGCSEVIAKNQKKTPTAVKSVRYEVINGERVNTETGEIKNNVLSPRSKRKIRDKITAWSMAAARNQIKPLTFVTLTFVNAVTDLQGVKILNVFLTNLRKMYGKKAIYLWVAERQKNGRIHFHIITSLFIKVQYWNKYWCQLQAKHGIQHPQGNDGLNPLDVRLIKSINAVSSYLTKYITKNNGSFACAVWNCSKKISELYTGFYDGVKRFVDMQRLTNFVEVALDYATVFYAEQIKPLKRLLTPLHQRNMAVLRQ